MTHAKMIAAVIDGESFMFTRDGVPVAELRPIHQTRAGPLCRELSFWRSPPPPGRAPTRRD